MGPDQNNPDKIPGLDADHDGKVEGRRMIHETVDLAALSQKVVEEFGENAVSDFLTETLRNSAIDAMRQTGVPMNADGSIDLVKLAGKSHLISRTRSIRNATYPGQSDDPVYEVKVDVGELREEFLAKVYELDPDMEMPNWLFDQLMLNAAGLDHQLTLKGMQAYFPDPIPGETVDRLAERTWTELSAHISRVESIAGKEIPNLALAPGKKSVIQGDLITSYYQQEDPRNPLDPTPLTPEDPEEDALDQADEIIEEIRTGARELLLSTNYEDAKAAGESDHRSVLFVTETTIDDGREPFLASLSSGFNEEAMKPIAKAFNAVVEATDVTGEIAMQLYPTLEQQGAPMTDQERKDAEKFTDYVGALSDVRLSDMPSIRRVRVKPLSEVDPKEIVQFAKAHAHIVKGVAQGDSAETILGSIDQKF